MAASYDATDLEKLSERERTWVNSIEDDAYRTTVACSLITHRLPDKLAPGDELPDLELGLLGSEDRVRLRQFVTRKPIVLAFGSYT